MDSFCVVKAEKACTNLKYNLVSIVRFVEVCVALVMVSWFSTRIPFAIRISSDFFRGVCVVAFSPRFVFLIGNAIVLTLFAKSGQIPNQIAADHAFNDLVRSGSGSDQVSEEGKRSYELCDSSSQVRVCKSDIAQRACEIPQRIDLPRLESESESENEKSWRGEIGEAEMTTQMSDEELRDRVEAFIAKQLRFHIEETKRSSQN